MHRHHAALSENLTNPDNVAVLLQKEKILTEEVVTSIETKASLPEKRKLLLTSVQYAVCTNPHNLLVFGVILKKFTKSVSQAILNDYSKYITILCYNKLIIIIGKVFPDDTECNFTTEGNFN